MIDLGYVERGEITEEQLDRSLDVLAMTVSPDAPPSLGLAARAPGCR